MHGAVPMVICAMQADKIDAAIRVKDLNFLWRKAIPLYCVSAGSDCGVGKTIGHPGKENNAER